MNGAPPTPPASPRPRLVPCVRLVLWMAAGSPLWLLALWFPAGWSAGAGYLAALLVVSLVQYGRLPAAERLEVRRILPPRFSLEGVAHCRLTIRNRSPLALEVHLADSFPDALEPLEPFPSGRIEAGGEVELGVDVKARRRGDFRLGDLYLRCLLPRGLVAKQFRLPLAQRVKVYPRALGVDEYRLLARIDERFDPIRRPRLIRGAGMEWESLREYLPGEDLRNVDWKASARRGALISRNLRIEKGQQVAVLIDAGRLMANRIGPYPRLEYAVNAAVMLGFACAQRGDVLSLATFSNRIETFMPATRGKSVMPRLLEAVYKVQSREVESDYWEVVAQIIGRLRKRALVVMLTDVLDAWGSSGLARNLIRAARRHLVLCVVMYEPRTLQLADSVPSSVQEAYLKAAACQLRLDRELALESMRARGIQVLETEPGRLSVQLVRRYLEIRREGLQ